MKRVSSKLSLLPICMALMAVMFVDSSAFAATDSSAGPKARRGYVAMRYGQLHYAISDPGTPASRQKPPLVMLHQTPNSLVEFGPLIEEMGKDRITIALDTPGYGGSDAPPSQPRIEDYAVVIVEALDALGLDPKRPVDLLGNHTGAFVATAIATLRPERVRRLALIGVFVVPDEELARIRALLPPPKSYTEVIEKWCASVPRVREVYETEGVPDDAWALRVDSLRPPATKREYGHEAAFEYSARARVELPKVTQPVLLMAVADNIEEATRNSASLFKSAKLVDLPHIRTGKGVYDGLFYRHTSAVADELRRFLD
jgi:pimeloyl-ACP methyl ester carboxylesterase